MGMSRVHVWFFFLGPFTVDCRPGAFGPECEGAMIGDLAALAGAN